MKRINEMAERSTKEPYVAPMFEVLCFEPTDIITTSGLINGGEGGAGDEQEWGRLTNAGEGGAGDEQEWGGYNVPRI